MPLKEEALSVADSISEIAEQVSCGNTLMLKNGSWSLTSTDVAGFDHALMMHGVKQCDSVLIIGAGATARAAMASVSKISKDIAVVSRNPERMAAMNKASDKEVRYLPWEITSAINSASLVINTTPTLAADVFAPLIEKPQGVFFEVLYNPWPTQLLMQWRKAGGYGIDGLDLLIHQAISQVEIFALRTIDRDSVAKMLRTVGEKALS